MVKQARSAAKVLDIFECDAGIGANADQELDAWSRMGHFEAMATLRGQGGPPSAGLRLRRAFAFAAGGGRYFTAGSLLFLKYSLSKLSAVDSLSSGYSLPDDLIEAVCELIPVTVKETALFLAKVRADGAIFRVHGQSTATRQSHRSPDVAAHCHVSVRDCQSHTVAQCSSN